MKKKIKIKEFIKPTYKKNRGIMMEEKKNHVA